MDYDVIVIGGATSGCYFARQLSVKGFKVKVIEAKEDGKVGRFDIFHIVKEERDALGLPVCEKGDGIWAFEFVDNFTSSPTNKYRVPTKNHIIGMHMPLYIKKMANWAKESGAEFEYNASFKDFIFNNGKIAGVKYEQNGEVKELKSKVVIDCSGMGAAGRLNLPKGYGIETNKLGPNDMFYVVLKYISLDDPNGEGRINNSWPNFKSWIAPAGDDPNERIYGIGACNSFEYAEKMFKRWEDSMKLPEGKINKVEYGTTPYTRPPYSLVADNFVISGDAACLTKPLNGEGVTSSMVQINIVCEELEKALKKGSTLKEDLWLINKKYNVKQGADFVMLRALMTKVVQAKDSEFEYFFSKLEKVLYKFMNMDALGLKISGGDILKVLWTLIAGILSGKVSLKTIGAAISGITKGIKLSGHYKKFPETVDGFEKWCKKADKLWAKVGKMS